MTQGNAALGSEPSRGGLLGLLWGPGRRLMGRVNFPTKALLISFIFLVPVLLLGYYVLAEQLRRLRSPPKSAKASPHCRPPCLYRPPYSKFATPPARAWGV